jgi:hypothetical protein
MSEIIIRIIIIINIYSTPDSLYDGLHGHWVNLKERASDKVHLHEIPEHDKGNKYKIIIKT